MPTDVEFDFGGAESGAESGDAGDAVVSGPRRRWLPVGAVVGVLVLVVAFGATREHQSSPRKPAVAPAPNLQTRLTAIALSPDPMGVTLEANVFGCPKVTESYPPTPSQLQSIMSAFPAFVDVESGPTIDGSSGLCSIDFRARDGQGNELIVAVSAPPHPVAPLVVDVNTDPDNDFVGSEYTSPTGFYVEVGMFEAQGQSVATLDQINQLAQDAALTW